MESTLAVSDRVLVKNQTTALQNGIYTVTAISGTATLTRANDFDTSAEVVPGFQVFVLEGTNNKNRTFAQTTASVTLNTTAISWALVDQVTAFDLVLTDVLPTGVGFQSVRIITPMADFTTAANGSFTGGSVTVPAVNSSGTITVNLDFPRPGCRDRQHAQGCDGVDHRCGAEQRSCRRRTAQPGQPDLHDAARRRHGGE